MGLRFAGRLVQRGQKQEHFDMIKAASNETGTRTAGRSGGGLEEPSVMEFAVFCIENLARRHHKPPESVYASLAERSDLLGSYLVPSYDFLHTQDKEYILDDLDRAMALKGVAP